MKDMVYTAMLAAAISVGLTTTHAHASGTCLRVDPDYGLTGAWMNDCDVGVTVAWIREPHDGGTATSGLSWVGPNDIASAYLHNARITWWECRSSDPYERTPDKQGSCH